MRLRLFQDVGIDRRPLQNPNSSSITARLLIFFPKMIETSKPGTGANLPEARGKKRLKRSAGKLVKDKSVMVSSSFDGPAVQVGLHATCLMMKRGAGADSQLCIAVSH